MDENRFSAPEGFAWGYFKDEASGARIRYGHVAPPGPASETVIITGGFCEPAEKYFEVIRERVARGASVWIMDWRGQGGSDRYLPDEPLKSHHAGYDGPIATIRQFVGDIVKKEPRAPLSLIAHSMGAHIGLRALAEHPGFVDRAVLSDPMFMFMTGGIPRPLARVFARAAKIAGFAKHYIPGGGPWSPLRDVFAGNQKTSDPARFRVQPDLFRDRPELRTGDPTFGWVWHSFRSCDVLCAEDYLKSIKTPVLLQISGANGIVDRAVALRAAALLPDCRRVDIPAAKHEIWMERDALRNRMLAETDDFLAARPKKAPAP